MYTETLQGLGLARNEARIYETLIKEGILGIAEIASHSGINRRNVYDSINRLMEKGLVFEVLEKEGSRYEGVNPDKLLETVKAKEDALASILPDLKKLYDKQSFQETVYIYKGIEGYKNYMRDILRVGQDVFTIGAKGAWSNEKLQSFSAPLIKDLEKKSIKMHILFDQEIKKTRHKTIDLIINAKGMEYRFLPPAYSTSVMLDVFGNRTVVISGVSSQGEFDEDASFTVIVNQQIADAFRVWFKALWAISKK